MSFWTDLAATFTPGGNPRPMAQAVSDDLTAAFQRAATPAVSLNVTQEEAAARAAPLLAAIQGLAEFQRPQVREATFGREAEAGFGLSGRAVENVGRALGAFDAETEQRRQGAISQAFRDIMGERQFQANLDLQREANRLQEEANKPWWQF